jgi:dephospho-CoA kinase
VVADILREAGVPVLDADVIARQMVAPGTPGHTEIAQAWPEVLAGDGSVDRKKLAALVFSDEQARRRLEAITHPRIMAEVKEQTRTLEAAGRRLAFLEAALLVETGNFAALDGLVVVTAEQETQVERVMRRDGCSAEDALARIRAQLPLPEKTRVADFVIDNNDSIEETRAQTLRMLRELDPSEKTP